MVILKRQSISNESHLIDQIDTQIHIYHVYPYVHKEPVIFTKRKSHPYEKNGGKVLIWLTLVYV